MIAKLLFESLPKEAVFLFYAYLAVEVIFYALFHLYLVPRANRFVEPAPYRDYGRNRHLVVLRTLHRVMREAKQKNVNVRQAIKESLIDLFDPIPGTDATAAAAATTNNTASCKQTPSKKKEASSSSSSSLPSPASSIRNNIRCYPPLLDEHRDTVSTTSVSSSDDNQSINNSTVADSNDDDDSFAEKSAVTEEEFGPGTFTVEGIGKEDMNSLFAWTMFGKDEKDYEGWEYAEVEKCCKELEKASGLVFPAGSGGMYKARRLTLEPVDPLHRPLAFYLGVLAQHAFMGVVLRMLGFQRVAATGSRLKGWYRPAAATGEKNVEEMLPLLFFHGLAPCGLFFYLPMILCSLVEDGRACFMFENSNISCMIGFHALTEPETVEGVKEIVDRFLPRSQGLCLCGHSFGTVPMTWLLHAAGFRDRIKQYVLLDPITFLLTEPDVMVNFLYMKGTSKIRLFAGSELFTIYYLRRHFFYYNSELYPDDIPASVQPIVGLSEKDEIVNAPRVKEHLGLSYPGLFKQKNPPKIMYWKGARHAKCVQSPTLWKQVKDTMRRQEIAIFQQKQHK